MNPAQSRFFVLNQIILGNPFPERWDDIISNCNVKDLRERIEEIYKLPRPVFTSTVRMLSNFIRVPDYTVALSKKGNMLPMDALVNSMRDSDFPAESGVSWVISMLQCVDAEHDVNIPRIADGVLYIPNKEGAIKEVEESISKALNLVAFGTLNRNEYTVPVIKRLEQIMQMTEAVDLTPALMIEILDGIKAAGIHPFIYGRYCLVVDDYGFPYDAMGALCTWADYTKSSVACVIPMGKRDKLTKAVISLSEFGNLCNTNLITTLWANGKDIRTNYSAT